MSRRSMRTSTSVMNKHGASRATVTHSSRHGSWQPPMGNARDKGRSLSHQEIIALGYRVAGAGA